MTDLDVILQDFENLEYLLIAAGTPISLAKMQGAVMGMICAGQTKALPCWEKLQSEMPYLAVSSALVYESFSKLFDLSLQPLKNLESQVLIALPADEQPLLARVEALADWCQGFLLGMEYMPLPPGSLSQMPIVTEILEDLAAIEAVSLANEESEVNEKSYAEIVEFIRVSVLLIHAECSEADRTNRLEHRIH